MTDDKEAATQYLLWALEHIKNQKAARHVRMALQALAGPTGRISSTSASGRPSVPRHRRTVVTEPIAVSDKYA
jgi:hypothetical protein